MRTRRNTRRRGGGKNGYFNIRTLKSIVKLGVAGMVAMYLANWIMSIGMVGTTITQVSNITGLSVANITYAIKGTTIATVAIRLHKFLDTKM